ncbi:MULTISPECIES: HAD family hydrolase [unclassified Streptomyces]|uniref:HAD family hydrolase n=1 Tax=Streptomyces evansiae TaxID=3075535 RepID=A0ABU2QZE1_9ACTN|nr:MULTISPECIES: HAD family hydrolase [unclassified Streptomyces]ASY36038.1 hydrolase [Streptomyces sp. CLI2509]MDT0408390.1 HAD family hydrolase [Streptomyces sp. DSM 41979]MDT0422050.1 HAD family hydrolase [Streptomyces sp. DSM 41859]MYQ58287.1 HAD-IIIA family hydrolase [Streptomyces sp. SID4926]MYR28133.1 HAD-IIIA family hydrolase [Streptomyces sp. SID4945]
MNETIVFDIGETLVKDDRYWAGWADWLGVPRHTVSALVGAAVAAGGDHDDALRLLRPGIDVAGARQARDVVGRGEYLDESDLYPDVRPALAALRERGHRVLVVGNQTARAGQLLRDLDLPVDLLATSEEWGLAKPSPDFFARVLKEAGTEPAETVYVGDHPAHDVFPAKAAGLRVAHLRRGPWGHWWAEDATVRAAADWSVDSLTRLEAALRA